MPSCITWCAIWWARWCMWGMGGARWRGWPRCWPRAHGRPGRRRVMRPHRRRHGLQGVTQPLGLGVPRVPHLHRAHDRDLHGRERRRPQPSVMRPGRSVGHGVATPRRLQGHVKGRDLIAQGAESMRIGVHRPATNQAEGDEDQERTGRFCGRHVLVLKGQTLKSGSPTGLSRRVNCFTLRPEQSKGRTRSRMRPLIVSNEGISRWRRRSPRRRPAPVPRRSRRWSSRGGCSDPSAAGRRRRPRRRRR